MGFFSFLKRNNKSIDKINDDSEVAHIWLDNFCQEELISTKNIGFINNQITLIKKKTLQSNAFGYSEAFVRNSLPYPTTELNITKNEFETFIEYFNIPRINNIKEELNEKSVTYNESTTKVFGYPNFKLFFDLKDKTVNNIWIELGLVTSVEQIDLIDNFLNELGKKYNLSLINWSNLELVNLLNKNQIQDYTRQMFK